MTDASESHTYTTRAPNSTSGPNRLNQAVAWVGIVAGIVFVAAVVFFGGFSAGAYSTGGYWRGTFEHNQSRRGPGCTMSPGPMGPDMMQSGGLMGPDVTGPGQKASGPAASNGRP